MKKATKKATRKTAKRTTAKAAKKATKATPGARRPGAINWEHLTDRVLAAVSSEGSRMAAIVKGSRCPGPTYDIQVSRTREALRRLRDAGRVKCDAKTWTRLR